MKLGKLTHVDLREHWKHEAHNFTRWLAEPDNIEQLADEIGIGIQNVQTEASVGRYNVDILAEEESTGHPVIIENQLEVTDHSHLGQLITYAAGLEAEFVIWVVREAREEHRQAVDWLNEHSDEHVNFFLVQIELWRIEDSLPAPKFQIISSPNEWKRIVQIATRESDLSATKAKQHAFWQQLKEFAATSHPELKLRTPRPQHWFDIAIGRSDCHIALVVDSLKNQVRCELYIPDSKELYIALLSNKAQIENQLGIDESLAWMELPDAKASRIRSVRDFDFADMATWDSAIEWLLDRTMRFKRVFTKQWRPRPGDAPRDGDDATP